MNTEYVNRCDMSKFQATPSFAGSFWWRPKSLGRDLMPGPLIRPTFFKLFIKCMFSQFIHNPTYTLVETPFLTYHLHVSATECHLKGVIKAKTYKAADQSVDKYCVSQSAYIGWYIKHEANTLLAQRQLSKWGLYFDYRNHTSLILAGRSRHTGATIETS